MLLQRTKDSILVKIGSETACTIPMAIDIMRTLYDSPFPSSQHNEICRALHTLADNTSATARQDQNKRQALQSCATVHPRFQVASDLPAMEWASSSPASFFEGWQMEVKRNDPFCFDNDIYAYLWAKVKEVVLTKRKIGQAGWAFFNSTHSQIVHCLVWADGSPCQTTPLSTPTSGERWWPCIIIMSSTSSEQAHVPFYCPALAWSNARPWMVHISRIRKVQESDCCFLHIGTM